MIRVCAFWKQQAHDMLRIKLQNFLQTKEIRNWKLNCNSITAKHVAAQQWVAKGWLVKIYSEPAGPKYYPTHETNIAHGYKNKKNLFNILWCLIKTKFNLTSLPPSFTTSNCHNDAHWSNMPMIGMRSKAGNHSNNTFLPRYFSNHSENYHNL